MICLALLLTKSVTSGSACGYNRVVALYYFVLVFIFYLSNCVTFM